MKYTVDNLTQSTRDDIRSAREEKIKSLERENKRNGNWMIAVMTFGVFLILYAKLYKGFDKVVQTIYLMIIVFGIFRWRMQMNDKRIDIMKIVIDKELIVKTRESV